MNLTADGGMKVRPSFAVLKRVSDFAKQNISQGKFGIQVFIFVFIREIRGPWGSVIKTTAFSS